MKTILLLICIVSSFVAYSQPPYPNDSFNFPEELPTIFYIEYDSSGNRIKTYIKNRYFVVNNDTFNNSNDNSIDNSNINPANKNNVSSVFHLKSNIKFYPNPTSGIVNIILPETILSNTVENIYLFDINGKLISTSILKSINELDITNFASGVYYLKLSVNNQLYQWKFEKY